MEKIKRRRYLVNKGFQFRYMGLVAIPLVLVVTALYYLMYYSVFNQILIPEAIATILLPAMKKVNIVAGGALPIILFGILRTALIYSNWIVGPIPRLERELDKVIAGDYSIRIKARNNDELKSLVNKINMVLEKFDKTERSLESNH
jgi:signal transduction histidine kinase